MSGQEPKVEDKRQLQIDFCDQYLEGDHSSALTTFQNLIRTYNSNISEYVLARGVSLYDSLNTEFVADKELVNFLEGMSLNKKDLKRFIIEGCPPFSIVDIEARYKEGMPALYKEIGTNISFPKQELTKTLSSKLFVQFVVQTDGSIGDVIIIKGEKSFENQISDILKKTSGQWSPGRCNCHAAPTKMIIPIYICLK